MSDLVPDVDAVRCDEKENQPRLFLREYWKTSRSICECIESGEDTAKMIRFHHRP
jgi:hypothetical protein